jgi:hypothetical protein
LKAFVGALLIGIRRIHDARSDEIPLTVPCALYVSARGFNHHQPGLFLRNFKHLRVGLCSVRTLSRCAALGELVFDALGAELVAGVQGQRSKTKVQDKGPRQRPKTKAQEKWPRFRGASSLGRNAQCGQEKH